MAKRPKPPKPSRQPPPTSPPTGQQRLVTSGVYVPDPKNGITAWNQALDQYDTLVGARPTISQWYVPWSAKAPFPADVASAIAARGQLPFVTWESWDWSLGLNSPNQEAYACRHIIAGDFDAYITQWAQGIKQYGQPLYLRVLSEANGNWNPWDPGVNGNTTQEYVAAWRHIHDIFTKVGVTNLTWLWTPNVIYDGSTPLAQIYPGDNYVDFVGLDGYNWGTSQSWSAWQTFAEVFNPSLAELASITKKTVWLSEIGCAEQGGDKAAWITDALHAIVADTRITATVWFDVQKEADWRPNSSATSLAAYRAGMSDPAYTKV